MAVKKAPPNPIDSLRYGGLSDKHRRLVARQADDPSTVLGNYRRMRTLPPPPTGAELIVELNDIVRRQAESTPKEREFAIHVDENSDHYSMWLSEVRRLTGRSHPTSEVDRIIDMSEGFLMSLKQEFDRARPYQVGPVVGKRIQMLLHDPKTPSYPSGHAFEAYLLALHFSDLHPESTFEFFALADMVADSRIVGGVHYASDIVAGRSAAVIAYDIMRDIA
jgi:acid phosphatase (class A)